MKLFTPFTRRRAISQRGFTTVELMVVVSIIAILSALAIPSFVEFIRAQRIRALSTDLYVSLTRARSEAIKRNTDVTIAPITAGSWQNGWTIPDPNNAGNNIESHSAFASVVVTGPANVVYQGSGRISGSIVPKFDIGATGSTVKNCVSIDLTGRPYTTTATC